MSDPWRQAPFGPPAGDGDVPPTGGEGGPPTDGREPGRDAPPPPPWENRERYGRLAGFLETVPRLLLHPRPFFAGQPLGRGPRDPLLFVVAVGVLTGVFLSLWLRLIPALQRDFLQTLAQGGDTESAAAALRAISGGLLVAVAPVLALVNVLVTAGIYHLVLVLVARPRAGFAGTLRVAAYGYGVNVLTIVPSCGGLLAMAWSVPVGIIGLVEIHRIDPWRAALAVVVPPLLCGSLSIVMLGVAARLAG